MSLPDPRQTSQVCPRCKIVLPLNQIVCVNCGFSVAYLQSGNASNPPQISAPLGEGQFKRVGLPSSGIPMLGPSQGSSLGISQLTKGQGSSLGISQLTRGQGSSLGISQPGESQATPPAMQVAPLVIQQVRESQATPPTMQVAPSAIQQGRGSQVASPIMQVAPSVVQQVRESQVASPAKTQSPSSSRTAREKPARKHATLIYLATVALIVVIVAVTGLHAAGISLATLTPPGAATPTITYALPKVAPLFSDAFGNDASGWNLQSSPGSYQVTVGNGALTIEVNKNKLLWEPLPGAIVYGNFTLTVNATLTQGDQNNGYGFYIRGGAGPESELDSYYRFELYGDASYAIFKGIIDQSGKSIATKVVNYTLSSAIQKRGKPNHIILIARGATLSFIVNGQLLKTFTDASYASGTIALFASNLPGAKPGVQVQFSQLALYPGQVSASS